MVTDFLRGAPEPVKLAGPRANRFWGADLYKNKPARWALLRWKKTIKLATLLPTPLYISRKNGGRGRRLPRASYRDRCSTEVDKKSKTERDTACAFVPLRERPIYIELLIPEGQGQTFRTAVTPGTWSLLRDARIKLRVIRTYYPHIYQFNRTPAAPHRRPVASGVVNYLLWPGRPTPMQSVHQGPSPEAAAYCGT
ncbi:hypothetical protein EVAR_21472_1 [Eumeta japonica]|uniref:Uncharacterized protein n=1 Tax=Eumeta variegata TaxID=151549 RepID=A0A4C1ZQA0_EUMVA|nr:hypothetical protein EVAR_21472_1 [Eumeta japonica]